MALRELFRQAQLDQEVDFLREGVRALSQALLELEVSQHLGAERPACPPERTGQRNGYRERQWDRRVGTIPLPVPRVRDGSYFPALLEPRQRAERALVAVIQEAAVHGVSKRRGDEVVPALGLQGISKSQVSRLSEKLDAQVERCPLRRLVPPYPDVWLEATSVKVRQEGRVSAMAVVVAIGVTASGEREVLGLEVEPSQEGAFWVPFLRGFLPRGLSGVQLVISDAPRGLKAAIGALLPGTSWQRCRVHFVRSALALVPKSAAQMVAATSRTVFLQPDAATAGKSALEEQGPGVQLKGGNRCYLGRTRQRQDVRRLILLSYWTYWHNRKRFRSRSLVMKYHCVRPMPRQSCWRKIVPTSSKSQGPLAFLITRPRLCAATFVLRRYA